MPRFNSERYKTVAIYRHGDSNVHRAVKALRREYPCAAVLRATSEEGIHVIMPHHYAEKVLDMLGEVV